MGLSIFRYYEHTSLALVINHTENNLTAEEAKVDCRIQVQHCVQIVQILLRYLLAPV